MAEQEGQAATTSPEATSQAASTQTQQVTQTASGATTINDSSQQASSDYFTDSFDPKTLPEELRPAYNQMRNAFTQKSQAFANGRKKIEAYDAFIANPHVVLDRLAPQYGYVRANQQSNSQPSNYSTDWQPDTWDDVDKRVTEKVLGELKPYLTSIQKDRKANLEHYLDTKYPDWKLYEDDMAKIINQHPTLAEDIDKVYQLAVPDKVLQSRATKQALEKINQTGQAAQMSGGGIAGGGPKQQPKAAKSITEAYEIAKRQLQEKGIQPAPF